MSRLYECTVWERPTYGDPQPVKIDGVVVSREIVAENAGKARYSYWRDVNEYWQSIRLQDIRVRSLARAKAAPMADGWSDRMELCNRIIVVIGSYGRKFLSENSDRREQVDNPFFANFSVDQRGELWFTDKHSRKAILVRHAKWPGFSDGGTLRSIIQHLAVHISQGCAINLGYFTGDHWGYCADMPKAHDEIAAMLTAEPADGGCA